MIAPQELRIGNFVNSPYDGHVIKVNAADIFLMANGHYREARFEPIELTEEWLLKFGFERHDDGSVSAQFSYGLNPLTKDYLIYLIWIKDSVTKECTTFPFYRNGHFEIKTVHQLQNLLHSLCGQELTIKEQK